MNLKQERDEWLMAKVAEGRREYVEPLVRRYANPLLTFIRRMVGDAHRSEELFQEVFLAVWRKRRQYRFPRPFKSWVFTIAANKCRAAHRRKHLVAAAPLQDDSRTGPAGVEPTPSENAMATETADMVATAVTLLPPQQRTVLVLRIWQNLSYAEIAEIVGRSEATVRSNMHHALAAMRKHLEPRLS